MKGAVPIESLEQPAAQLIVMASEDGELQALALQLSIAISAKRQADAMEAIRDHLEFLPQRIENSIQAGLWSRK